MQGYAKYISIIALLIIGLNSCKRAGEGKADIDADIINYEIVYMENMAGDIPTSVLPKTMEAIYTRKYIKTSIKGFFGQFSLTQIANLRKNTVVTLLNFLGHKVYYVGEKGEIPVGIVTLKNPEVEYHKDTLNVCGMQAKRATVTTEKEKYDIYYIEEINIKDPNITTPYYFIDFVLSDFRVQLSMLKMRLIMEEHTTEKISFSEFDIPGDYKEVSHDSMESIINNLFTKE